MAIPESTIPQDSKENSMRRRIDRLESMVKKLASERQHLAQSLGGHEALTPESPVQYPGAASINETQSIVVPGRTVMDGIQSVYVGGDGWDTVLQEVSAPVAVLSLKPHSCPDIDHVPDQ